MRVDRSRQWRVFVPLVCLVAGVGFAASARDSRGTDLRAPATAGLADLVQAAEGRVQAAGAQVAGLQARVTRAADLAGRGNAAVTRAQRRVLPLLAPGGLTAMHGPGIVVILDDAAGQPAGAVVDPNQLIVHQSDLQAVVNALWAGGAEAMTIADQRVIATSAVRCVGNTLLLNGRVFSPPFQVAAIGPARAMQGRLDASLGVQLFKQAAEYYGLGYTVGTQGRLDLPAYTGPITLSYAKSGK